MIDKWNYNGYKVYKVIQNVSGSQEIVTAKVTDRFNFVHYVTLTFDCGFSGLKTCKCSCGEPACPHAEAVLAYCDRNCPEMISDAGTSDKDDNHADSGILPGTMEVLFGNVPEDDRPLIWRPNDTEQVFHTNTGIIGTMGTGKTQFTKSLVTQLVREQKKNFTGQPLSIMIFDYKGDYNESKTDFVNAAQAKVYKPYRIPYNPFSLIRLSSFRPLLPTHTANTFVDTVSRIFTRLGPKQQQVLMNSIMEAYRRQGIKPEDPSTWDRTAPVFDQVYKIYTDEYGSRNPDTLTAAMDKIYNFCIFENRPGTVRSLTELLKGVVVFDLSGYEENIQNLIVAITLDQFYAQMQQRGSSMTDGRYRELRSLILVDEADHFMGEDFPSLRKIMKEGREAGVGVILSTQSLTHFTGDSDDYSRYILTWVVHNVGDLKMKDVEYIFRLQSKSEEILTTCNAIKSLEKHQSVVKVAGSKPVRITDRAFWQLLQ